MTLKITKGLGIAIKYKGRNHHNKLDEYYI